MFNPQQCTNRSLPKHFCIIYSRKTVFLIVFDPSPLRDTEREQNCEKRAENGFVAYIKAAQEHKNHSKMCHSCGFPGDGLHHHHHEAASGSTCCGGMTGKNFTHY